MSLVSNLVAGFARVGTEFKTLRQQIQTALGFCRSYDLFTFINGKPLVGEILLRILVVRPFAIDENFSGSFASASFAATSAFQIEVLKQGVRVATIDFAAGSTTGVFNATVSGSVLMSVGNEFAVRCVTNIQDATLSDLAISIRANTFVS